MKSWLFFLIALCGCAAPSLEEYQYEGEKAARAFVKDLQKIRTREELATMLPKLKKHYQALVELMIEGKELQRKHPDQEEVDPAHYPHLYVDILKEELERICTLEGGREMLEKAEKEALIRLDYFSKKKASLRNAPYSSQTSPDQ